MSISTLNPALPEELHLNTCKLCSEGICPAAVSQPKTTETWRPYSALQCLTVPYSARKE